MVSNLNDMTMKKISILFSLCFLAMVGFSFGQTNVYLQINHKLGTAPFGFNAATTNNLTEDFDVTRLEYYISEITLIHDGGMETTASGTYVLANAGTQVNEMIGSFSITTLEGVRFGIGVDAAANHLDPSAYAMTHPLAPKSPSMHWGWNSGYRFVALEGNSGSGLNQIFQIHALGDNYYQQTTVNTAGYMNGTDLVVVLDADYEMALKDISVINGPITHGDFDEAIPLLSNFNTDVFSEGTFTVGTEASLSQNLNFVVAPNPNAGNCTLRVDGETVGTEVYVREVTGRLIGTYQVPASGQVELNLDTQGLYFVSLQKDGEHLISRKVIVTR